ncbi:MGH1-like glycoside hydrolase domain-containing protein [Gayadomonas joobiniege]|uniref:MGH1-like glycoside hydrolase domain-containing protein n=1 Tax=Gayadomonas joobiniege TaxID=1234606 RepID=UPI00036E94FF|nr:hypothetical protein [Gayadomonas joobiniege]
MFTVIVKSALVSLLAASTAILMACSPAKQSASTESFKKIKQLPTQLYLRGSFNSWGLTSPLTQVSDDSYQVGVDLGLGVHSFKVADDNWSFQLTLQSNDSQAFELKNQLEKPLDLQLGEAEQEAVQMMVEEPGEYQFLITVKSDRAWVKLTRLQAENQSATPPHNPQHPHQKLVFKSYDNKPLTATFSISETNNGLRNYVHSTTQKLRDPVPQFSLYQEKPDQPLLRSGNLALDALFALAVDEVDLNSVSQIKDSSYNKGLPIACDCFETGEKWHYVWTRDLAYAAHLGLAWLDPQRVKNSLEFKLSGYRDGITKPTFAAGSSSGLQIIQDTGSGGSWPISTDRVTWAFGAEAALNTLTGDDRSNFIKRAYEALVNTIENDRLVAYDQNLALYTGEQSFLDWREQSYAAWLPDDLTSMATSAALSTNVAHYQAIRLTAKLAGELKQSQAEKKYQNWANELKTSINDQLWLADKGLYSSLTAGHFDKTPLTKFDWLGQALAIISGVADTQKSKKILASYPHGPMGAPVIFPQQQGVPVYHNRAIWPFVTAYGLQAAIEGDNYLVADQAYQTLIRSAALNLSNMENLEWLSAQSVWLEKTQAELSGPVINSKRQLWSVAAYLNMVIEGVFGLKLEQNELTINPYITTALVEQFFSPADRLSLQQIKWKGKKLSIDIQLPERMHKHQGAFRVEQVSLNGQKLSGQAIKQSLLTEGQNLIQVELGLPEPQTRELTQVAAGPGDKDHQVFAPYEPDLMVQTTEQGVHLRIIDDKNQGDVSYQIFRNGQPLIDKLPQKNWFDSSAPNLQACYSVAAVYASSGNTSHHSPVVCRDNGSFVSIDSEQVATNVKVTDSALGKVVKNWGHTKDELTIKQIEIKETGEYAFQFAYTNYQHNINTGITNGVKWLQVYDETDKLLAQAVVQMPHGKKQNGILYSSPLQIELAAGIYRVSLHDFFNMSYLTNNQSYTAAGGIAGPVNLVNLYGLRLMPVVMNSPAANHSHEH